MLRVGLTGDLGSGKSTVARLLAAHGAIVMSSDDMAREMMQPGHKAYNAIVALFGDKVLHPDGTLNRNELARLAFDHGRVEDLNAIIHPAVIAEQIDRLDRLRRTSPHAIIIIESALILSTKHSGVSGWHSRFDKVVLVTAPAESKVQRFIHRVSADQPQTPQQQQELASQARKRLAAQNITPEQAAECILLPNDGTLQQLEARVNTLWSELQRLEAAHTAHVH